MADKEEGEGSASARAVVVDDDRSPENLEDNLSFLDKLKCMMYSKVERDAFLIEKLEKEEKKKGMRTKALSLHQQGWSWTKIATELGCHRTTVMRLVHKWQQTGCISDLPHRRRPRSNHHHHHQQQPQQQHLNNNNNNQLQLSQIQSSSSNGQPVFNRLGSAQPLRSRWQEENRKITSSSSRHTTITVRRRLKELRAQLGIQSPPSPEPVRSTTTPSSSSSQAKSHSNNNINNNNNNNNNSGSNNNNNSNNNVSHVGSSHNNIVSVPPTEKHQRKPLRTLQEISSFSPEEIGYMVFSDMKIFLADKEGGVRVWRLGQPPLDSYAGLQEFFQKGGLSATFWVCISGSGKKGHLLHIPNELTEERYVQILHNGLLPSAAAIYGLNAHRFLFAQDRASIQASPVVEDFLCQQQVQCAEWPARSAELNPCDLLWPEVERCVTSVRHPRNVQDLVQLVREGYEAVETDYIQWLVTPVRIRSLCRRMLRASVQLSSQQQQQLQQVTASSLRD